MLNGCDYINTGDRLIDSPVGKNIVMFRSALELALCLPMVKPGSKILLPNAKALADSREILKEMPFLPEDITLELDQNQDK
jgi:hypothetical protein